MLFGQCPNRGGDLLKGASLSGSIERHVFNYVGGVLGGGAVDIGGGRLTLNY